ncbi:MAG: O-antigen ligase family protein [Bacteroidetes bacterium]|nr:O-antigen ligase family protein [Bacteroidota bacterium]
MKLTIINSPYFKKTIAGEFLPFIWSITLILYILRSVFLPFKFLFFFSLFLLGLNVIINFKQNYSKLNLKDFYKLKEIIILGAFLVIGILISNKFYLQPIKDLSNFLIVLLLVYIYQIIKPKISIKLLLQLWVYLTLIIGILGLIKWQLGIRELNFVSNNYILTPTTSFVSDSNFYGNHIILTIILFLYGLQSRKLKNKVFFDQIILWVFILNISLTGSRRSIMLLVVLILITVFYLIFFKRKTSSYLYQNLKVLLLTILGLIILFIFLLTFRTSIIKNNRTRSIITSQLYSYSTIIYPNIDNETLYCKLWFPMYKMKNDSNLLYNGNFERGKIFWGISAPDSISHTIITTKYGNAIRVSRFDGKGWWPLLYKGPVIQYKKNYTYQFSFKFRVIKGKGAPFKIGWWLKEDGKYIYNLKKDIKPLDDDWNECICTYTFKENHFTRAGTFMNSQHPFTVIDFADISLICLDCNVDNSNQLKPDIFAEIENNKFISPRTNRWRFAYEIFNNYNFLQKMVGNGFNYGSLYSSEFIKNNSSKFDYPHNPILSAFLYSGLTGGFYYIYFLVMSFYYYIKNRKFLQVFLYMYIVTFFFMMFSANSHFSVPIFTLLSILPFIENIPTKKAQNAL